MNRAQTVPWEWEKAAPESFSSPSPFSFLLAGGALAPERGFRQNTDPRSTDPLTDPLLTPYKINGKMNTAYLSLNNPF